MVKFLLMIVFPLLNEELKRQDETIEKFKHKMISINLNSNDFSENYETAKLAFCTNHPYVYSLESKQIKRYPAEQHLNLNIFIKSFDF